MSKVRRPVQQVKLVCLGAYLFYLLFLAGCGPSLSTPDQIDAFEKAGEVEPSGELDESGLKKTYLGPYRVIAGDVLEFQMPIILRVISSNLSEWLRPRLGQKEIESYYTRINQDGNITLPIIGQIHIAGKTLAEIEATVIDSYYPKYVVNSPMVVCEISKYVNESERIFSVMGLVGNPKVFPYPPDVRYSLMEALAFAGGLNMVADPRYVKIYRQDLDGQVISAVFSVDSKAFLSASRIQIKPGDIIYVDHTLRTRTNQFLSDTFQFRVSAAVNPSSFD